MKNNDIHPLDFWDFNFGNVNHRKTSRLLVPSIGIVDSFRIVEKQKVLRQNKIVFNVSQNYS